MLSRLLSSIIKQDNEDIEEANIADFKGDSTVHKLDNEIENLSDFLPPNTVLPSKEIKMPKMMHLMIRRNG